MSSLWCTSFRLSRPQYPKAKAHRDSYPSSSKHSSILDGQHKQQLPPCPSSDLWDLVLDMDWERVLEHVLEHPEDAQWTDGHYHETVLYLACQHNPPLSVICAILHAFPQAAIIQNTREHDLPLHIACRYQLDDDILDELVRDFPETAVKQTRWGGTALGNLWKFRQKQDENGASAVPMIDDKHFWNKVIVLVTAVARYREQTNSKIRLTASGSMASGRDPISDSLDTSKRRHNNVSVESLIQNNADSVSRHDPPNSFLVHAAVSLGSLCCPLGALEFILEHFPEQIFARDSQRLLPLHIAVGPSPWNDSTRRKYRPREQAFIDALLRIHPDAAKEKLEDGTTNHNRHPLHVALVNRHLWNGGIEELFQAAPDVLLRQDPVTLLYPFQLAAVPSGDTTVDLETIFQLLRSRPDVLNTFDMKRIHGPPSSHEIFERKQILRSMSRQAARSSPSGRNCSPSFQNALLGTVTAFFIGGVVGIIFAI